MDILLFNPHAGTAKKRGIAGDELLAKLKSRGIDARLVECDGAQEDTDAAIASAGRVIVAGGDGTVHSALRAVSACGALSMAIVPVGTANHLAEALGIPEDVDAAIDLAATGHTRRIDLGIANGVVFSQAAGAGLHARIFHLYGERVEKSALGAAQSALAAVSDWQPRLMRVVLDDLPFTEVLTQVTAANTPSYGRSFRIAPDALVDDGYLDVVLLKELGKLEMAEYAAAAVAGRLAGMPKAITTRARRIEIESTGPEPVDIHADALAAGQTPAVIEVLPGCLEVVVPEERE